MNVVAIPTTLHWQQVVLPVCQRLKEELLDKPLDALDEIGDGLKLAIPELVQAVKATVAGKLSPAGQARLKAGLDQLIRGVLRLRWHLLLLVLLLVFGWKAVATEIAVTVVIVVLT